MVLAAMGEEVEAVAVAQADVGQHQVVGFAVHGGEALGKAGRPCRWLALLAEPVGHRGQHVAIVVDQQQRSQLFHVVTLAAPQCGLYRATGEATAQDSVVANIYVTG